MVDLERYTIANLNVLLTETAAMGLLGILLALALLMWLAYKGWSILLGSELINS